MSWKVAYYAHHFGTGHLRHAQRLAQLEGIELQVASTGARRHDLVPAVRDYVALEPDAGPAQDPGKMRPGDHLHYAPVGQGIQRRFTALNRAWARFTPDVVMVDVSVEVALFARLSGYPVAFRRMPGDRQDQAHRLAYAISDGLFGYFPEALEDPAHLAAYSGKSHYLPVPGTLHAAVAAAPGSRRGSGSRRRVVVQTSLASAIPLRHLAAAAAGSRNWTWEVAGAVERDGTPLPKNLALLGVVPDPARAMRGADVLVSSAGHNAVAAAAACNRPVLLVPEERPHGEQLHFARALERAAGIPMLESWAAAADWPALLQRTAGSAPGALAACLFGTQEAFTAGIDALLAACVHGARS